MNRTRHITFFFFTLLLGLVKILPAQVAVDSSLAGLPVNYIIIHGNDRTRDQVILREMKQQKGAPLDLALVEEDQKRILNLQLFNRVIIIGEPYKEGVLLRVVVTEMWYIYPFPILYINEKDWDKLSYGAGISHMNFRGNNETLSLAFWLGWDPGLRLDYMNPWFGGGLKLYTNLSLSLNKIRSKHFQNRVDERHSIASWTIGRRFGYHTLLSLDLGARRVSFSPAVEGGTLSEKGTDTYAWTGLRLQLDHRDLFEYPHKGWLVALGAVKNGLPGKAVDYWRFAGDLRAYLPLPRKMTLAFRNAAALSRGTVPIYDMLYLGYSERIRGHFTDRIEGTNRYIASAALRFPLLPIRYVNLADYPYLRNLKFGISMGIFADAGLVWQRYEDPALRKMIAGYGVGLHFHLPYVNLIRFELAFDEQRQHEYVLDLFTAF